MNLIPDLWQEHAIYIMWLLTWKITWFWRAKNNTEYACKVIIN